MAVALPSGAVSDVLSRNGKTRTLACRESVATSSLFWSHRKLRQAACRSNKALDVVKLTMFCNVVNY